MYTSAMNKKGGLQAAQPSLAWLGVSLGCVAVTNIYALFGHGIRSSAMDFMFLYPLLGGALIYLLAELLFRRMAGRRYCRLASNLYNSGIATLTTGGMLRGILDIAGTDSDYVVTFGIIGWGFVAFGVLIWIMTAFAHKD